MSLHNCQFITGFHMEPGEDGDPIFCDAPAGMHIDGIWYCAEHFDEVEEYQRTQAVSSVTDKPFVYRQGTTSLSPDYFIGVDLGFDRDTTKIAVFAMLYDKLYLLHEEDLDSDSDF